MEEQHSFDEFFRESLADYRETPPPAAWDMVAQRLDDDDRRRRRGFFYWPWTVLSFLLILGGAWWLYGWNSDRQHRLAANRSTATEESGKPGAIPDAATGSAPASENITYRSAVTDSREAGSGSAATELQQRLTPAAGRQAATPPPDHRGYTGIATANGSIASRRAPASGRPAQQGTVTPLSPAARSIRPAKAPVRTGTWNAPNPAQGSMHAAAPAMTAGGWPVSTASVPQQEPTAGRPGSSMPAQLQAAPDRSFGTAAAQPSSRPAAVAGAADPKPPAPLAAQRNAALKPEASAVQQLPDLAHKPGGTAKTDPLPPMQEGATAAAGAVLNPDLAATITAPVLLASLDPVLHVFAGAAMPPILSIYETGLLDPTLYQAPPPEMTASSAPTSDAAAAPPAMYPPDSNLKSSGRIMSLSAFLGYERGIKTPPRNMFTVGIGLMWQLSRKLAVGTQPALLYGNMPRTSLTTDKAYQRSAVDVTRFMTRDYSPSILGQVDTVNNYVIREAFDSIIVRGTYLKGNMWQLELPLILQFNPFGAAFRLYGGPSVYVAGGMKIRSEGPESVYTIDRKDSIVQSARMTEEQIKNYFGKSNLESYSNYNPDLHSFNNLDPVRFGYQFGAGYQRNRLSVDISVRQQLTGYHQLSDRLRQLYALPAFRLSLGYNLIPARPAAARRPIPYAN